MVPAGHVVCKRLFETAALSVPYDSPSEELLHAALQGDSIFDSLGATVHFLPQPRHPTFVPPTAHRTSFLLTSNRYFLGWLL